MKMLYGVDTTPKQMGIGQTIIFAFQQLLAIMSATIAVPAAVNKAAAEFGLNAGLTPAAALFGAGAGTIVYLLFTKFKSPIFLGSSFAFIGSMTAAFAGGVSMTLGYLGLVIGALFAALVYVILAIIVKKCGTGWIDKVMPAVVIGPTVAVIGLSLSGYAVSLFTSSYSTASVNICILCGFVTLVVTVVASIFGKKMVSLIPFIIGILGGYVVSLIFTLIGNATDNAALSVINFAAFSNMKWIPDFSFLQATKGFGEINASYLLTIAAAYIPVAFVVFAEHIADHKNLSSIIEHDLLTDPGLNRTLLGDGVGSFVGALFGGCPNTTYGESIACVALTRNASAACILVAAVLTMLSSFFAPFVSFLDSIPACVMGAVCVALYGFIAISGLKMIQDLDFNENKNIYVISAILITGIGNLELSFGNVTITNVACALIVGIILNLIMSRKKDNN